MMPVESRNKAPRLRLCFLDLSAGLAVRQRLAQFTVNIIWIKLRSLAGLDDSAYRFCEFCDLPGECGEIV